MADADEPAKTDAPSASDRTAPPDTAASPSKRWLDGLLWASAPSTDHLKKFHDRAVVDIPPSLFDGFESVDSVQVLGLPDGAEVVNGRETDPGTWTLAEDGVRTFAVLPPPESDATSINLTIKLAGPETAGGDIVSVLGGVVARLPKSHKGPLFADLPDMRQARERRERERVEIEEKAKQGREEAARKKSEEARPTPALAKQEHAKAEARKTETVEATHVAPRDEPKRPPAPTRRPKRRAAVTLQPVSVPEKPNTPAAAVAGPVSRTRKKPARRAAVTLKPVKTDVEKPRDPETRADETAPERAAKPAVRWTKPIKRIDKPKPSATPRDLSETGSPETAAIDVIAIEIGGAPEVGDPHFRVLIDGEQVLDGNIDWGLGLPASDGSDGNLCWQTREIKWDAAAEVGTVVLRYDHGNVDGTAAGILIARAVTVNGLQIDADGPYARYPEGRWPWAGRGDHQSWRGDLVFNIAGARLGDPGHIPETGPVTEAEAETGPTADPAVEGEPPQAAAVTRRSADVSDNAASRPRPLILRLKAEDLANPGLVAAFMDLRQRIKVGNDFADGPLGGMLRKLNFDDGKWSDLVVLDPSGNPVALDSVPIPPPDDHDRPSGDAGGVSETGQMIRERYFGESLARAHGADREPAAVGTVLSSAEGLAETTQFSVADGRNVRDAFLAAWSLRAKPRKTASPRPPNKSGHLHHLERGSGETISRTFLTSRLQFALGCLREQAAENTATPSKASAGAKISAEFLEDLLRRAGREISVDLNPTTT